MKLGASNFLSMQSSLSEFMYTFCGNKKPDSPGCHKVVFKMHYGVYDSWERADNHEKDKRNHNGGSYVFHPDPKNTWTPYFIEKGTFHLGSMQSKLYIYGNGGRV